MGHNWTDDSVQHLPHTVVCSIGITVGAMAILGNIANLLVLPNLPNVIGSYRLLLISLAVADLSAGLFQVPYLIYSIQTDPEDKTAHDNFWCRACGYLINVMTLTDVAIVMCVAIYKYVTITKPLRYSLYITSRKTAAVVVFLFLLVAVILGFFSTDDSLFDNSVYHDYYGICVIDFGNPQFKNWTVAVFTLHVYVPMVVVCYLYGRIAMIARQQAKRIATTWSVSSNSNGSERDNTAPEKCRGSESVSAWKGLRSALILTFGFIFAWLPFTVVFILITCGVSEFSPVFLTIIGNMTMSTTWWNYIVYSLCSAEFRYTFRCLLKKALEKLRCSGQIDG